jgi:Xaa-Pro dipeptidase
MQSSTDGHYGHHLNELIRRYNMALAMNGFDAVLIGAGLPVPVFRDDQDHPYRAEPLFLQWAPLLAHPGSCLLHRPGQRPVLLVHAADDYWHAAAPVPPGPWEQGLEIRSIAHRDAIPRELKQSRGLQRLAVLGDPAQWRGLNLPAAHLNPPALLTWLDYTRARKTAWEVANIEAATRRGLAGHRAVRDGFAGGLSEFELGLLFLAGCGQTDAELPYPAIVAMNANGATLHYQHRQRERPAERHSLLLDAGAAHHGYASDITRSYAARRGLFADMVADMDQAQQGLCALVRPGVSFPELQLAAHHAVAGLLHRWGLVRMAPADQVDARITDHFLPHGLGHLLGLQVHDVGGDLASPRGGSHPRPARFPRLRLTRPLEADQVVTIEPGIYFIDSLLAKLERGPHRRAINWRAINALRPCGGIRIEDDVLVTHRSHRNLTRDASGGL